MARLQQASGRAKTGLARCTGTKFEVAISSGHGLRMWARALQKVSHVRSKETDHLRRCHEGRVFQGAPVGHRPVNVSNVAGKVRDVWTTC